VVPELQPLLKAGTLIRKRRYSGFFETDLEDRLRAARPEQVTVVGVCTDICVLHTVADLRNRDYRVVVPASAVETFDSPGHPGDEVQRWSLAHLQGVLGARVT
jgi:nicotinamidase/pyrazinamidase